MSWSASVPPTEKSEIDAAIDAAEAMGQPLDLPGVSEDVTAAKEAAKALAGRVKRSKVAVSLGGHSLQDDEGSNFYDGISVSVSGSD